MFLLLAFLTAFLAILPTLIVRKFLLAAIAGGIFLFLSWGIYYLSPPSLVWPLFGFPGGLLVIWWVIMVFATAVGCGNDSSYKTALKLNSGLPIVAVILYIIIGVASRPMFRADEYAAMIGKIEERVWTQDV